MPGQERGRLLQKFVECRAGDHDTANAWFTRCQSFGLPYLRVHPSRKYASVHWDHVSMHPDYDAWFRLPETRALDRYEAIFRKHCGNPRADFRGGELVGVIDGVSLERARLIAEDMFDFMIQARPIGR